MVGCMVFVGCGVMVAGTDVEDGCTVTVGLDVDVSDGTIVAVGSGNGDTVSVGNTDAVSVGDAVAVGSRVGV